MSDPSQIRSPDTPGEVQLIILGSGTSAGVPVIGCDCDVCRSDDPRDNRTRSGACVRFVDPDGQPRVVLIDTPPDLRQQALRHDLTRCDAILYTHNHVDHTFGLDDVRRFNVVMRAPIDVYADRHTLDSLARVYQHIFKKEHNVNDSFVATLLAHEIVPPQPVDLFGLRFSPLELLHGRLPVLGFRIEAIDADGVALETQSGPLPLAYCTDVSNVPPQTWAKLEGLDTLVLDMLRYRKHPTHLTVDEAVETAGRIGASRTFFTHMTHDILHADLDPRLPPGMALSYDGLIVEGPARPVAPQERGSASR
ncbi:MAG: MBL fold metallo-hydrolase [Planctomycetota bacterium]|jgi:phosphoribosyl 1,2-cyclic phosphate phosphodiesterase